MEQKWYNIGGDDEEERIQRQIYKRRVPISADLN